MDREHAGQRRVLDPGFVAVGVVAAGVVAFAIWQLTAVHHEATTLWVSDIVPIAVGLVALGLCWRTALSEDLDRATRKAWSFIAAALTAFWFGDVVWFVYEVVLDHQPFPSAADVFYLAFYPLLLTGLLLFPVSRRSLVERRQLALDLGTVLVVAAIGVWYLVLGPTAVDEGSSVLTVVLSAAYPVGDLVLMFGLVAILSRGTSASRQSLVLLLLAVTSFIVADVGFGHLSLNGEYQGADWPDTGWLIALVLFGASAASQHADARRGRKGALEPPPHVQVSPLPYVATVVTWGMVVYAARHEPVFPLLGVLVGGLLLTFLVFARQILAVNAHAELMARYQELAGTDSLTGIYNRRRFIEEAEREISRSRRTGEHVSLLMMDVDHFKVINDGHGHLVGDAALAAVASDLRAALREGDLLGRCGGDEFIALLPGCDAEQAVMVAERVQARRVLDWGSDGSEPIQLGLSIGVATGQLATLDSLLARADDALYEAKEAGRGCTRFAAPEWTTPASVEAGPVGADGDGFSAAAAPPPGRRGRATDAH